MTKERVLIVVKTYPTLSRKYTELVCTAGFRENGSWIRLYPSPFRFLNPGERYRKYQWIELEIEKNPKDTRPESYRPINIDNITLGDFISTGRNREWEERRKFIFSNNKIHTNLATIIKGAKSNEYSLVIFKPKKIIDLFVEKVDVEPQLNTKQEVIEASLKQGSLFKKNDSPNFKLMPQLPFKFSYRFIDDEDKKSTLKIIDWEIGQLYLNCYDICKKNGQCEESARNSASDQVKKKYFNDFALTKDIYLFLGTTSEWHKRGRNPYVIIGIFPLPDIRQASLF